MNKSNLTIIIILNFIILTDIMTLSEKFYHNKNIIKLTKENKNFRKVIATAKNSQIVLMNILPNEDIGEETHDIDQIIIFTEGKGQAVISNKKFNLESGSLFLIPAFTKHNFINTGSKDLKLLTIYSPPEFKKNITEKFKVKK